MQIVPGIRHNTLAPATTKSLKSGSPILVTGPQWVARVLEATDGHEPWVKTRYAGTAGSTEPSGGDSARIHVDAPSDASLLPTDLPESKYRIEMVSGLLSVSCEEPSGFVQALRAISQLPSQSDSGDGDQYIDDSPAFAWRGIHLDVGRHFFGVEFIKKLLRLQAWLGFNVFHWHLTEDQGWRIPIPGYPLLTDVGAWRSQPDGSVYGGFYTPEQIQDVVAYAGSLGILVVPEIELPGHASAAIAAYPDLSCRGEAIPVPTGWGIHKDVFCAGNEDVFALVDAALDEVCKLFPSRIVHIGGDECPKDRWNLCPKCKQRMAAENLSDADQLQSYVIGRAARMLEERGRLAIGWDEILEGGLPEGTLVMSWRGTEGGATAAAAGHKVVMSPTSHCYLDYRQTDADDAPGFAYTDNDGNVPVTPIDKVFQFDPRAGLEPAAAANVLGGQGNVWTEQMETEKTVEEMISPRIVALAEALWRAPSERDFEEFRERAVTALRQVDAMGWRSTTVPELG